LQGFKVIRERRRVGAFIEESMRIDRSSADLIVAVDGERFKSAEDFLHLVEQRKPGDVVKLTVVRGDGSKAEIPVRLTEE
jgi:S1-C subfamily serine protease